MSPYWEAFLFGAAAPTVAVLGMTFTDGVRMSLNFKSSAVIWPPVVGVSILTVVLAISSVRDGMLAGFGAGMVPVLALQVWLIRREEETPQISWIAFGLACLTILIGIISALGEF